MVTISTSMLFSIRVYSLAIKIYIDRLTTTKTWTNVQFHDNLKMSIFCILNNFEKKKKVKRVFVV